jgi:TPR repeat protein
METELTSDQQTRRYRGRVIFVACVIVFQLGCTTTPREVDFSSAKDAYSKGDYRTALMGFKKGAQQGNPEAQLLLAKVYADGRGIQQDYSEAFKWYKRAAEHQNPIAEYAVGKSYGEGQGVSKDTSEAIRWLRLASEHGNGDASFYLGDIYYRGSGVPVDRYEAVTLGTLSARQGCLEGYFLSEGAYNPKEDRPKSAGEELKWLKFGAEKGVATAQVMLGVKYLDGDGVPRQYAEAERLFRSAAGQDNKWANSNISVHEAQWLLGDLYQSGRGVAVDHAEAAKWYRLAADNGIPDAQYAMGVALVRGEGVPQDYSEGVRYYRLAADQGNWKAQGALGAVYFSGSMGVPQDYVQAHLWLNLAAVYGNPQILKIREAVERTMTPAQLAEAQKLAREWKPKKDE